MNGLKLNLGAKNTKIKGFKNVDIIKTATTDFVCNVKKLNPFKSASVIEIYASHILEHFEWRTEVDEVLKEWNRVLKKGGVLWVAVPDWDVLVKLYLKTGLMFDDLLAHIYGDGQTAYSLHKTCFTYANLMYHLNQSGFSYVERVVNMPYGIKDASTLVMQPIGVRTSLNVKAIK